MMFESPWGATHPIRLRPVTIPDDAFEDAAENELRLLLPRLHLERGRAIQRVAPVGRATYYRPDIVVYLVLAPTPIVHTIADAKRRLRLTQSEVARVADYRDNCGGPRALVYVPQNCHVTRGATRVAGQRGVSIERRAW